MASIARALEGFVWKGLQEGLKNPDTRDASVVTEYFHNMHAMALYRPGHENGNFHPIAACTMAGIMALASCFFVRLVEGFIPRTIRTEVTLVAKGAPLVYAASIIATAAYSYTIATEGISLDPKPIPPPKR